MAEKKEACERKTRFELEASALSPEEIRATLEVKARISAADNKLQEWAAQSTKNNDLKEVVTSENKADVLHSDARQQ